jgi:peptidoglycan biosynthesis protein MviN/MurJ (putative lipid II flippase)
MRIAVRAVSVGRSGNDSLEQVHRFRSKKTIGFVELFIRIQIVVFTLMAVVEDVFRFLLAVLLAVGLLGCGVHWVIKRKKPNYHPANGWVFGKRWVFIVGLAILCGSIWILGAAISNHGAIWRWEILHGINDILKIQK